MAGVKPPLIGITPDVEADAAQPTEGVYLLRCNYAAAVAQAGGLAVLIPCLAADPDVYAKALDGFIISGSMPGVQEQPGRTVFEMALIRAVLARGKPLLGICNGMQLLGRVLGGQVVDIPRDRPGAQDHIPQALPTRPAHQITIAPGTRLHGLAGTDVPMVNSLHRQALTGTGEFRIAALATPDQGIEAIEGPGFSLGLQWHPEYCLSALDRAVFAALVWACT